MYSFSVCYTFQIHNTETFRCINPTRWWFWIYNFNFQHIHFVFSIISELTAAIKRLFPGQVKRRYEAERRTLHRSYPLPGHSSHQGGPVTRPWFTIPRFRQSDTSSDRMQHFTSRVNRARQRRQQLHRSFLQELCSETTALLMFFVVFISVVIAFLTLMFEFSWKQGQECGFKQCDVIKQNESELDYWFFVRADNSIQFSMYCIVLRITKMAISLEPYVQFWWVCSIL